MCIGVSRQKNSRVKGVTHEKKLKKTCMHKQPVDKHWPHLLNAGMAMTTTVTEEEIYIAVTKNCFTETANGSRKLSSVGLKRLAYSLDGLYHYKFLSYISLPVFPFNRYLQYFLTKRWI